jgi:hypothetical protein
VAYGRGAVKHTAQNTSASMAGRRTGAKTAGPGGGHCEHGWLAGRRRWRSRRKQPPVQRVRDRPLLQAWPVEAAVQGVRDRPPQAWSVGAAVQKVRNRPLHPRPADKRKEISTKSACKGECGGTGHCQLQAWPVGAAVQRVRDRHPINHVYTHHS